MVLAVGEYVLDDLRRQSVRMATGFAGGLGDTEQELCGALSGGVMIIGALFGRTELEEDDQPAVRLASRYRQRFLEELGTTQCARLRDDVVNVSGGLGSCGALVERAAMILLMVLSEAR
ncbi:MAG: C-GCAxxG-C-C family protein [Chloroflexota bacterium]|nr:C-GCAxxG-C-C family protein [Chloroflexota bacterium]